MAASPQHLVARLMRLMGLSHGGRGVPAELVSAQLRGARAAYPLTFACTLIAGLVVVLLSPRHDLVGPCFGLLVAISLYALRVWHRDRRDGWQVDDPQAVILHHTAMSFITAAAWNLMLGASLVESAPEGRVLTCGIMAGVMAVGALSVATLPMASMAFLAGAMVVLTPVVLISGLPLATFPMLCVV